MMFNWISLLCLAVEIPFESGEEYGNFSSGYGSLDLKGLFYLRVFCSDGRSWNSWFFCGISGESQPSFSHGLALLSRRIRVALY